MMFLLNDDVVVVVNEEAIGSVLKGGCGGMGNELGGSIRL